VRCGLYLTSGMSGGDNKCEKALAGKPEQKRRLGRPRLRWKYNIKMGLTEMRFGLDSRREYHQLKKTSAPWISYLVIMAQYIHSTSAVLKIKNSQYPIHIFCVV
jgi:hypothetical protein